MRARARPAPAEPEAGGAASYQGAKNMTKCAALWMPCVNMSAVYTLFTYYFSGILVLVL